MVEEPEENNKSGLAVAADEGRFAGAKNSRKAPNLGALWPTLAHQQKRPWSAAKVIAHWRLRRRYAAPAAAGTFFWSVRRWANRRGGGISMRCFSIQNETALARNTGAPGLGVVCERAGAGCRAGEWADIASAGSAVSVEFL
jgi:hypothetical protein